MSQYIFVILLSVGDGRWVSKGVFSYASVTSTRVGMAKEIATSAPENINLTKRPTIPRYDKS